MDRGEFVRCKQCEKILMERFEVNREHCLDCWIVEIVEERIAKVIDIHLIQEHEYDD